MPASLSVLKEGSQQVAESLLKKDAELSSVSTPETVDLSEVFAGNAQAYLNLGEETQTLIATADSAGATWGYTPAFVALTDPCGIAMDIASLSREALNNVIHGNDEDEVRALAVSSFIENLKKTIHEDAENQEINRRENEARRMRHGGYLADPGAVWGMAIAEYFNPEFKEANDNAYEVNRLPTPEGIAEAKTKAWDDYATKLNDDALESWQTAWTARLKGYDTKVILPLTQAHAAWLQSSSLFEWMDCNHDTEDVHSGHGFVDALLLCIQDTQQYGPCMTLYSKWLSATTIEKRNLLLRALSVNHDAVIAKVNRAVGNDGLQPELLKTLPWNDFITAYEQSIETVNKGAADAVVRLTAAVGGPLAATATKAVDRAVGPVFVLLGMISKAPVVMVDVTMSKANAIAELVSRMLAVNPEIGDLKGLHRAIDIEMRKARIYGTQIDQTGRYRYLILMNTEVVADFPGMDENGKARAFVRSALLTEADYKRLTQQRWKNLIAHFPGGGLVAGILQVVALGKLADDLDKSMAHELNENKRRYTVGCAALAAIVADTTGKWLENAAAAGSKLAQRLNRYVGVFFRGLGKLLGLGSGMAMAVLDVYRGYQELSEGDFGIGILYIASGVMSAAAALIFTGYLQVTLLALSSTGIGIILVALVVIVSVLIEVFKDNKLQDWLERCYFGKFDKAKQYSNLEIEMKQLELALEG